MTLLEMLKRLGVENRPIKFKYFGKTYIIDSISDTSAYGYVPDANGNKTDETCWFVDQLIDRQYEFPSKKSCTL